MDNDGGIKKYVLIGNPGVGKSTVLNGFVGKVVFPNGPSFGGGLTKALNKTQVGNNIFMDTPGLADVKLREKAAAAITKAMKEGGQFIIIFVLQLIEGRMRPEDVTTMKLVLESAPITDYAIIFNKLEEEHYDALINNEDGAFDQVIGTLKDVKPPTVCHHFMKRQSKIAGKKNVLPEIDNELYNFIIRVPIISIEGSQVKDIQVDKYEAMMTKMEEQMRLMREDNAKLQAAIAEQANDFKQKMKEAAEREKKLEQRISEAQAQAQEASKKSRGGGGGGLGDIIGGIANIAGQFLPGVAGNVVKGIAGPIAKIFG